MHTHKHIRHLSYARIDDLGDDDDEDYADVVSNYFRHTKLLMLVRDDLKATTTAVGGADFHCPA